MANIIALQNGKVKVVRNRFGLTRGRDHRLNDRYPDDRMVAREKVADVELSESLRNGDVDREVADRRGSICRITGEARPVNGVVAFLGDSSYVTLIYRAGRLLSAHCLDTSRMGHHQDMNLWTGSVEYGA